MHDDTSRLDAAVKLTAALLSLRVMSSRFTIRLERWCLRLPTSYCALTPAVGFLKHLLLAHFSGLVSLLDSFLLFTRFRDSVLDQANTSITSRLHSTIMSSCLSNFGFEAQATNRSLHALSCRTGVSSEMHIEWRH